MGIEQCLAVSTMLAIDLDDCIRVGLVRREANLKAFAVKRALPFVGSVELGAERLCLYVSTPTIRS
jgi:hypothetical protein